MTVRDATMEDNEALVALAAQCPMNGHLALCIDRAPDFFALNRLGGGPWRVGVIDGDTGPVACVAVARRRVFLGGRPTDVGYVGDLKVHPAFRRRGAARALAGWAVGAVRDIVGSDAPLVATVLSGNAAVEALQRDFAPGARRLATIRSHSISLLWRRRTPPLTVRVAEPADVPAMVALWRRLAPSRQFAPVHDHFPVATSPGLEYLVAQRPGGELAGFTGLWDQHRLKQMRVTGYSPRLAAARLAFNLAAPIFRVPPLPPPGGTLNYRTVVNPCATDPDTLRSLLLHGCERLRGHCSFLTIGLDRRDPLTRALDGMLAQPTDVDILSLGGPASAAAAPLHFEIATV